MLRGASGLIYTRSLHLTSIYTTHHIYTTAFISTALVEVTNDADVIWTYGHFFVYLTRHFRSVFTGDHSLLHEALSSLASRTPRSPGFSLTIRCSIQSL